MSSLEETQQPSFHVRAQPLATVLPTAPTTLAASTSTPALRETQHPESQAPSGSSHPGSSSLSHFNGNGSASGGAGTVDSLEHWQDWHPGQNNLPDSIPPREEHPGSGPNADSQEVDRQPLDALPAARSTWKTGSSLVSSEEAPKTAADSVAESDSGLGRPPSNGNEPDALDSKSSSSRARRQEEAPYFQTPPDNDGEELDREANVKTGRKTPSKPSTPVKASSVQADQPHTPTHAPLNHFMSSLTGSATKRSNGSNLATPSKPLGSPSKAAQQPSRYSPRHPNAVRKPSTGPGSDQEESFGQMPLAPRLRVTRMLENYKFNSTPVEKHGRTDRPSHATRGDLDIREDTPELVEQVDEAKMDESPPENDVKSSVTQSSQHSQSRNTESTSKSPHPVADRSRAIPKFMEMPPSSGNSESSQQHQSQLFSSQSNMHDFGDPASQRSFQFAATQIAAAEPSASSPSRSQTAPASEVPEQQQLEVTPRPPGPSQVSNGTTHTSVPSHRRLGRVNPRAGDVPVNHPPDGQAVSLPGIAQPARPKHQEPPRTAPIPVKPLGDMEATQVDGDQTAAASSPQRPNYALARVGLQDTFVDAAPISPPPEANLAPNIPVTSSPRQNVSSPRAPSRSSLPRSSPLARTDPELQPTYVDQNTLPTQPPRPRVSPKQYGRQKGQPQSRPPTRGEPRSTTPSDGDRSPSRTRNERTAIDSPEPEEPVEDKEVSPSPIKPKSPKGQRLKRKARDMSDFTSGGGSDSSSPAPEDPEDYTYRPIAKAGPGPSKKARGSTKIPIKASGYVTAPAASTKKATKSKRVKLEITPSPTKLSRVTRATPTSPLTPIPSTGRSGQSGIGMRVFGWWPPTRCYYPGTVTDRQGDQFHVDFDDGTSRDLSIGQLRRMELKRGERIKGSEALVGKGVLEVLENWTEDVTGVQKGVLVNQDGEPFGPLAIAEVHITNAVVKKSFDDRLIQLSDFAPMQGHLSVSPVKSERHRVGDVFSGKIFLVTAIGDASGREQAALIRKIKDHGGRWVDDWTKLFDLGSDGFGSTLKVDKAPFLIVIGGGMKPKTIAAFAFGIPVLASTYIDAAIESDADWRSYLISPGVSSVLGVHGSQVVDPRWGEAGWLAAQAHNLRNPFEGLSFVFLHPKVSAGDQLSPIRQLVPFCLNAMGAATLQQIHKTSAKFNLNSVDVIIIEDRCQGQAIPQAWADSGKLCNFVWLKQCIISGCRLPADVIKE